MKIDNKKFDIALAESGYTAEQLSKKSGVAQVTIARIKNGKQDGRPSTIGKIAKALKIKAEDLVE